MRIIINDTNIFIDLHSIGLLEEMCKLPYEIHTVDFVEAELTDLQQKESFDRMVSQGLIFVDKFSPIEVAEIVAEHATISSNLSIPDCSVCYYARKHRVPMLTGDRRLRLYAERQSIEVHGVLFVFDELVRHDILSPCIAADRLEALQALNTRLPRSQIITRLEKWRVHE